MSHKTQSVDLLLVSSKNQAIQSQTIGIDEIFSLNFSVANAFVFSSIESTIDSHVHAILPTLFLRRATLSSFELLRSIRNAIVSSLFIINSFEAVHLSSRLCSAHALSINISLFSIRALISHSSARSTIFVSSASSRVGVSILCKVIIEYKLYLLYYIIEI